MICKKCGAQIDDKAVVCVHCGTPTKNAKKPITKKWWFWVLIVLAALIVIGSVAGTGGSNDTSNPTEPPKPETIKISPEDLYSAYKNNEISANEKYEGKLVELTGVVNSIGTDILNDVYITFDIGEYLSGVQCYFEGDDAKKVGSLSKGQTVTIIGTCDGFSLTSVLVKDCKITSDVAEPKHPTDTTEPVKPATDEIIEISASDLFAEYQNNSVAADQKYKGKKLKVTGTINDIGKDIADDTYITIETGEMFYEIQCYFLDSELDDVAGLKKGDSVTLIGTCDGMSINVILKRCEIQK